MVARITFCKTDPRALQIAREIDQSEKPAVTVLYGSRARGDYAEGRSDVDLLLVQEDPPTEEQRERVDLKSRSLSVSIYRGQRVNVQVIWLTLDEFNKSRRFINNFVGGAIDHGIILSNRSIDYGAWSRRASTSYYVRAAERHLGFFLAKEEESEPNDYREGVQAYLALQAALKAVV